MAPGNDIYPCCTIELSECRDYGREEIMEKIKLGRPSKNSFLFIKTGVLKEADGVELEATRPTITLGAAKYIKSLGIFEGIIIDSVSFEKDGLSNLFPVTSALMLEEIAIPLICHAKTPAGLPKACRVTLGNHQKNTKMPGMPVQLEVFYKRP